MAVRHFHSDSYSSKGYSGGDRNSRAFQKRYGLKPRFNIECKACCWSFLVKQRKYEVSIGGFDCVTYGKELSQKRPECYLCMGQEHGQFQAQKSGPCRPRDRILQSGYTYQLYENDSGASPGTIPVGKAVTARLESIALTKYQPDEIPVDLKPDNVAGTTMNYFNAALLELFRMKNKQESLRGKVEHQSQSQELLRGSIGIGQRAHSQEFLRANVAESQESLGGKVWLAQSQEVLRGTVEQQVQDKESNVELQAQSQESLRGKIWLAQSQEVLRGKVGQQESNVELQAQSQELLRGKIWQAQSEEVFRGKVEQQAQGEESLKGKVEQLPQGQESKAEQKAQGQESLRGKVEQLALGQGSLRIKVEAQDQGSTVEQQAQQDPNENLKIGIELNLKLVGKIKEE